MKEEHIPTARELPQREVIEPCAKRRDLQDGETGDVLRMEARDRPRHARAPVVTDDRSAARAEVAYETRHVINKPVEFIVRNALRFVAQIVAA